MLLNVLLVVFLTSEFNVHHKCCVPPYPTCQNHAQNEARTRGTQISEPNDDMDRDPSLARTNQYLKNHQDAERVRKSKSKVAQAAEATSGNG